MATLPRYRLRPAPPEEDFPRPASCLECGRTATRTPIVHEDRETGHTRVTLSPCPHCTRAQAWHRSA